MSFALSGVVAYMLVGYQFCRVELFRGFRSVLLTVEEEGGEGWIGGCGVWYCIAVVELKLTFSFF